MHCAFVSVVAVVAGLAVSASASVTSVASGDVSQTSTILWANPDTAGNVQFQVATDPGFSNVVGVFNAPAASALEPAKVDVGGLAPGTQYYYRATDASSATRTGSFRTAAAAGQRRGLRFGVSGDWRGELAPYPSVKNVPGRNLDFFTALGDTIYADYPTPAVPLPQATTLADYRAKHREVYSPRFGANTLGDLRASTSVFATIDDHEVTNDFQGGAAPSTDPRFAAQPGTYINETDLYRNGLQAFHDYNPIRSETYGATGDPRTAGKTKLYRSRSFGSDAAVIVTDQRSFRDQGLPAADPLNPASVGNFLVQSFNPARTMLGQQQVNDVKSDLLAAQNAGTTWKFVNIGEPIQNLGVVGASDRYEGYAAERNDLLRFIDQNNIDNVVFISADIHGTLVNNVTYQNAPGGPQIHTGAFEVSTGSVAFDAPFGPTVAQLAAGLGIPGSLPLAVYNSLPLAQKEAYVEGLINAQITPLGYDPMGLQGSEIDATLLVGGYTATNTFGWTEFGIDPTSQLLTVTTWGILPYTEAQLLADPAAILSRDPFIVSQFQVRPIPAPSALAVLGLACLATSRRRRSAL